MVKRWARSKNRLPPPRARSTLDTCAVRAAWWAARNRLTRSSGVSPLRGRVLPLAGRGALPPGLGPEALEGVDAGAEGNCLEEAWGVVDVKRVASDALRGETRDAIVGGGACEGEGLVSVLMEARPMDPVGDGMRVKFCSASMVGFGVVGDGRGWRSCDHEIFRSRAL
jgi:hypothetical protein